MRIFWALLMMLTVVAGLACAGTTGAGEDGDRTTLPTSSATQTAIAESTATLLPGVAPLESALPTLDDLPDGFYLMGPPRSFPTYTTRWGSLEAVRTSFAASGEESEKLVMVDIAGLPPEALPHAAEELNNESLANVQEHIDWVVSMMDFDVTIGDVRMLDGNGLGDGGYGFHYSTGDRLWETFRFIRGNQFFKITIVWNRNVLSPPLDARALAELVDAKAQAALAQDAVD